MTVLRIHFCVFLVLGASPARAQVQSYLVDSAGDALYSVDLGTGSATWLASTFNNGLTTPADLAWVESSGELWTVDFAGGEVGTLDPATGMFAPRFTAVPANGWQGLAWEPSAQRFLLANGSDDGLYSLDPATGQTSLVGYTGASLITCLDFDPSGALWGIEFFQGGLVRVDTASGAATPVATAQPGFQGLGIDPFTGVHYGVNSQDLALHEIDPGSGASRILGALGGGVSSPKGFDLVGSACNGVIAISGSGCADSTQTTLAIVTSGFPCRGRGIGIGIQYGVAQPYLLVMGISDQTWYSMSLPFALDPLGAPGCSVYTSGDAVLGPLLPGSSLRIDIPRGPILYGVTSFWQGFVLDPALATPLPLAASDLLAVTIG